MDVAAPPGDKDVNEERKGHTDAASRVLDVAEVLVQERGFNGFSYADIAAELGVTKPALHYHFATKSDLGTAVLHRYTERFAGALEGLGDRTPVDRLEGYAELYRSAVAGNRMCLCGMLAAEFRTLPEPMRGEVRAFFDLNERWLTDVLVAGSDNGSLSFRGEAIDSAHMIIDCLEGAVLIARPYGDCDRFDRAAAALLDSLRA